MLNARSQERIDFERARIYERLRTFASAEGANGEKLSDIRDLRSKNHETHPFLGSDLLVLSTHKRTLLQTS